MPGLDSPEIDLQTVGVAHFDDDKDLVKMSSMALGLEVGHVITDTEPEAGVQRMLDAEVKGQSTEVVVLDGRRGWGVAFGYTREGIAALKEAGFLGRIAIILATADAAMPLPDDIAPYITARISKPFSIDTLLHTIAEAAAAVRSRQNSGDSASGPTDKA